MERAFGHLGRQLNAAVPRSGWQLVHEYPLSDRLLAVTTVWNAPETGGYVVTTKGAPEAIATLCGLDDERTRRMLAQVSTLARRGSASSASHGAGTLPPRFRKHRSGFRSRCSAWSACRIPFAPACPLQLTNVDRRGSASS